MFPVLPRAKAVPYFAILGASAAYVTCGCSVTLTCGITQQGSGVHVLVLAQQRPEPQSAKPFAYSQTTPIVINSHMPFPPAVPLPSRPEDSNTCRFGRRPRGCPPPLRQIPVSKMSVMPATATATPFPLGRPLSPPLPAGSLRNRRRWRRLWAAATAAD